MLENARKSGVKPIQSYLVMTSVVVPVSGVKESDLVVKMGILTQKFIETNNRDYYS